ncbi:MAG: AAA family ATPase, partial [Litorimonas sp.]
TATGATGSVTQQFVADHRHLLADGAKASKAERADWSDRVVVLDEASQVSYAHGEELMRVLDALRPRKIVLMGDRDQTNSVAAGNWFELLQDRGLPTDTLREVVRQKGVEAESPELLRSAQKVANGDTLGALYALSDRIREAPKQPSGSAKDGTPIEPTSGPGGDMPVEPLDYVALAAQAAFESDRTGRDYILYAPTNSLRQALNENFRAARREAGDLGADTSLTALKPLYTSPAFMGAASSYRRGDVLHFGRSVARGTYEKDSLWTVITVNPERNILTLVPQGTSEADLKRAKRHWRLQPMERFPFTHLSGRDVSVAVGDEIAFGLRDAALRIGRGQQAVVTAITDRSVTLSRPEKAEDRDAETAAAFSEAGWIRVEGGKAGPVLELTLPRDHVQVQSLQHAYAFTTYTVQGQSRDQAIVAMHAQSDAVNRKSVGVSITREERDLQIYTNDVRALHRNAVRTDDAALPVTELDPDRFGGLDPLTAGSFADQSRAFAEARATRSVSADGSPEDRERDVASLFGDDPEPLSWDNEPIESREALIEAQHAFDPDVWDGFGFGDETDIGVHQREVDDREADHAGPASLEAELDDRAGHDVGASR